MKKIQDKLTINQKELKEMQEKVKKLNQEKATLIQQNE